MNAQIVRVEDRRSRRVHQVEFFEQGLSPVVIVKYLEWILAKYSALFAMILRFELYSFA